MNEVAPRPETGVTTMMERLATSPDVDVAKLEKLLEMQERVIAREAEAAFNAAFAELQSEMPIISERGEIKHSGRLISKYALFEDINEAVKPTMQKHGFGVSFRVEIEGDTIVITGILMHRDGHREQTSMALPADTSGAKNNVQAMGSSVSYGKRYVLCALLNISTRGEDDDGTKAGLGETLSDEQIAEIRKRLKDAGRDESRFLKHAKVNSLSEIPAKNYETVLAEIDAVAQKAKRNAKA